MSVKALYRIIAFIWAAALVSNVQAVEVEYFELGMGPTWYDLDELRQPRNDNESIQLLGTSDRNISADASFGFSIAPKHEFILRLDPTENQGQAAYANVVNPNNQVPLSGFRSRVLDGQAAYAYTWQPAHSLVFKVGGGVTLSQVRMTFDEQGGEQLEAKSTEVGLLGRAVGDWSMTESLFLRGTLWYQPKTQNRTLTDAQLDVGYRWTPAWSTTVGFRYVDSDYSDNELVYKSAYEQLRVTVAYHF